jgi:hypothetical protein
MGRPLNKKYFGNRNIGTNRPNDDGIGGEGVASITFGGTNNSTGFTNGSTTQATFSAPQIANGTTATGTIVTYAAGALTNKTTYGTYTGTGVSAAGTFTGVSQKSTSGSGTGATFVVTKTSGTAYSSTITVTLNSNSGQGYALNDTVTIDGAALGGVTVTNDLTFTIGTFVATTGTIKSITITNKGSGYTTAPSLTLSTGTQGTLTVTPVLNVDSGAVGTSTNNENAILAWAYTGGNLVEVDLQKQISTKRYRFNKSGEVSRTGAEVGRIRYDAVADGTAGYTASEGKELNIVAVDASGGTYLVRKLYNRTCTVNPVSIASTPATLFGVSATTPGAVYTAGKQYKWTFGTATADTVKILNA